MRQSKNGSRPALLQDPKPEPLLTVADVADWFQVDKTQVYDLCRRGAIPTVRVDGAWRFSRHSLKGWVLAAIR